MIRFRFVLRIALYDSHKNKRIVISKSNTHKNENSSSDSAHHNIISIAQIHAPTDWSAPVSKKTCSELDLQIANCAYSLFHISASAGVTRTRHNKMIKYIYICVVPTSLSYHFSFVVKTLPATTTTKRATQRTASEYLYAKRVRFYTHTVMYKISIRAKICST